MLNIGRSGTQEIRLRERQRLIVTYDGDETCSAAPETAEEQIRSLVQAFEGSHVGIFQRCVGLPGTAQRTNVPGLDPRPSIRQWVEAGVDQMAFFVDECHKCGMQAWGSCRMNDAHHTYPGLDYSQSRFYTEHPELRLRSYGSRQLSATYDWNKRAVAEQNLAFLREVAETWDVDGIDLDFTRIGPFFNSDEVEQGRRTMNQHLRNVRAMLDEVGKREGKRLGLSAQLYTSDSVFREIDNKPDGRNDIEECYMFGLDVRTWVRQALLDVLIAHCRSASLYEMDVSAWREVVKGTECRLAAGPGKPTRFKFPRGGIVDGFPAGRTNRLQHRGITHRLYEQGVDGIFFYDYIVRDNKLQWDVFRELGDPERLRYANKTYVSQMALPLALGLCSAGGEAHMEIDIADDIPAALKAGLRAHVRLLVNVTRIASADAVSLRVNDCGVVITPEEGITLPLTVTDHPDDCATSHLQAVLDPALLKRGRNHLVFTLRPASGVRGSLEATPAEVRKVDTEITYRDETYPYWLAIQLKHKR